MDGSQNAGKGCELARALPLVSQSSLQAMEEREATMAQIEASAADMHKSGACAAWFRGADQHVQQVGGLATVIA